MLDKWRQAYPESFNAVPRVLEMAESKQHQLAASLEVIEDCGIDISEQLVTEVLHLAQFNLLELSGALRLLGEQGYLSAQNVSYLINNDWLYARYQALQKLEAAGALEESSISHCLTTAEPSSSADFLIQALRQGLEFERAVIFLKAQPSLLGLQDTLEIYQKAYKRQLQSSELFNMAQLNAILSTELGRAIYNARLGNGGDYTLPEDPLSRAGEADKLLDSVFAVEQDKQLEVFFDCMMVYKSIPLSLKYYPDFESTYGSNEEFQKQAVQSQVELYLERQIAQIASPQQAQDVYSLIDKTKTVGCDNLTFHMIKDDAAAAIIREDLYLSQMSYQQLMISLRTYAQKPQSTLSNFNDAWLSAKYQPSSRGMAGLVTQYGILAEAPQATATPSHDDTTEARLSF